MKTFHVVSSTVYLNVTNIETYNVDHDKFCVKWTPHRSATSYRIKLNPVDRKSYDLTSFTIRRDTRTLVFENLGYMVDLVFLKVLPSGCWNWVVLLATWLLSVLWWRQVVRRNTYRQRNRFPHNTGVDVRPRVCTDNSSVLARNDLISSWKVSWILQIVVI